MSGVAYLDLDDLLVAAEAFLGHAPEVRDYGLLESASTRPQATVFGEDAYPGVHPKAAALLSSLVGNHALVDGNKRLGLLATHVFLGLNGHALRASDDELFDLVVSIAEGRLVEVADIGQRLEAFTSPHD